MDPTYYYTRWLTKKSDVYSFGVVLLELMTGHSPIVPIDDSVSIHIGEWVQQNLDQGSIEIIDSSMGCDYDINSVWKVADLALHCKQEVSRERPTMTDVVAQIKESMELKARRRDWERSSALAGGHGLSYAGERNVFEVERNVGEISEASLGPAMR